jgi:hypothetical protein
MAETTDVVDEIDRVDAHIARPLLDHADPRTGTGSHTNPEPPQTGLSPRLGSGQSHGGLGGVDEEGQ